MDLLERCPTLIPRLDEGNARMPPATTFNCADSRLPLHLQRVYSEFLLQVESAPDAA